MRVRLRFNVDTRARSWNGRGIPRRGGRPCWRFSRESFDDSDYFVALARLRIVGHADDRQPVDKPKHFVRYAKITAGFALLPVGAALLVLPGPGLPVLACSLMLLEDEYSWAGSAREGLTQGARRGANWLQTKALR